MHESWRKDAEEMKHMQRIFCTLTYIFAIFFSTIASAQNTHLFCEGRGLADNGATNSNHTVRLSIIFSLNNKSISIDKLQQIAPGSLEPIKSFDYTSDEIFFDTPNEYLGGRGLTQGKINRYTGAMYFHYAIFGSSIGTGLASFQANLICKPASSKQF